MHCAVLVEYYDLGRNRSKMEVIKRSSEKCEYDIAGPDAGERQPMRDFLLRDFFLEVCQDNVWYIPSLDLRVAVWSRSFT